MLGRVALVALVAVVTGCAAECVGWEPPPFHDCEGGCFATMTVTATSGPDVTPFSACEGFDFPCSWGPRGYQVLPDAREGLVNGVNALVLRGWMFRLDYEPRDGGRARVCRTYWDDTTAPDPCWSWECASAGSVVLTEGGGHFHADFSGGQTVDGAFYGP